MSAPDRLLLHSCCAPCLIAPYQQLKADGVSVSVLWYNPNIHPVTEYRLRLQALKDFAATEGFPLILKDVYGLRDFVRAVAGDTDSRCEHCYRVRLEMAAKTAAEQGFEAFSSTLFFSKYQNHELMLQIARELAEKYGTRFFYRDWRELWEEGKRLSLEAGMYRQKYCGCVFSEEERYLKLKKG